MTRFINNHFQKIDVRLPKPTYRKTCKLPPIKMNSSRKTVQTYASLSVRHKTLPSKPTLPKITSKKQENDRKLKMKDEDLLQSLDKVEPESIRSILSNGRSAQDSSSQNESMTSAYSMIEGGSRKKAKKSRRREKPGVRWGKDSVQLFLSHN